MKKGYSIDRSRTCSPPSSPPSRGFFDQVLRGAVVVTGGADAMGNTQPLSDQDLRHLEAVVDRISGVGQKPRTCPSRSVRQH